MSTPYYSDDHVTLYLGDSLAMGEWHGADLLVTDPPYGTAWRQGAWDAAPPGGPSHRSQGSARRASIRNDHGTDTRDRALQRWGSKPWAVFGTWKASYPAGWRQVLVWRKPGTSGVFGATMGFRRDTELVFLGGGWPKRSVRWSSVLPTDGSHVDYHYHHPHSKPVTLLGQLLDLAPGAVADPFAGTGATLVAAKLAGRLAIGVEVVEEYCEWTARRLSAIQAAGVAG